MSISSRVIEWAEQRAPDFIIGKPDDAYLLRWWLLPRNRLFNIYVHKFLRSDDDRALHDHPWLNASFILRGQYAEHQILAGGINVRNMRIAGKWRFRLSGKIAHRVELTDGACWTLFITGPRYREWGFHCPERGWVLWTDFTSPGNTGEIGKGCEDI